VESLHVVLFDKRGHQSLGVLKRGRGFWSNALVLDGLMKSFELAIRLRIVRRGSNVRHATELNKPDSDVG